MSRDVDRSVQIDIGQDREGGAVEVELLQGLPIGCGSGETDCYQLRAVTGNFRGQFECPPDERITLQSEFAIKEDQGQFGAAEVAFEFNKLARFMLIIKLKRGGLPAGDWASSGGECAQRSLTGLTIIGESSDYDSRQNERSESTIHDARLPRNQPGSGADRCSGDCTVLMCWMNFSNQ